MRVDFEVILTTKGGPHPHVHVALNLSSSRGRPCCTHAFLNLHDAIPIDNHAIYTQEKNFTSIQYPARPGNSCTWFETPTKFCNHPQSAPLPTKLAPKQRALILLVLNKAHNGTPPSVVQARKTGACGVGFVEARE